MLMRLVGLSAFVAVSLGSLTEARAQEGPAPEALVVTPAPDPASRSVELRTGWGLLANLQQHTFAVSAHVFLLRRFAVGGQFEAYGDTVARQPSHGAAYHNGGALEGEYVFYPKQLSATASLELFGAAGVGATVLRPRTNDNEYQRFVTVVASAGVRVVFANRASLHLALRDTMFVTEGPGTFLLVPRLGVGVAF